MHYIVYGGKKPLSVLCLLNIDSFFIVIIIIIIVEITNLFYSISFNTLPMATVLPSSRNVNRPN